MGNIASSGSKILFLALFAVFSALPAFALPKERTAVADAVVGLVELSKPSSDKWKKVKTGAKITHRDQVRTSAGARIDVRLPDGSTLSIDENSVVDFKELLEEDGNTKSNVRVDKGTVFFSIKKLTTAQSEFKFETQTATAAIRGTRGYVQALDVPRSRLKILEGSTQLSDLEAATGASATPKVGAGQTPDFKVERMASNEAGTQTEAQARAADNSRSGELDLDGVTPEDANARLKADEAAAAERAKTAERVAAAADNTKAPGVIDTSNVSAKKSSFYLSNGLASVETKNGEKTTIAPNQLVTSEAGGTSAYQVPPGVDVQDLAKKTAHGKLPKLQQIPLTGAVAVTEPAAGTPVSGKFRMYGRCTVPDSLAKLMVAGKKVKVSGGEWSVELTVPEGEGQTFDVPVALTAGNQSSSFKWSLRRAKPKAEVEGEALEIWGKQPFAPQSGVIEISGQARCPVSAVVFQVGNAVGAATLRFAKDESAESEGACTTASFSARVAVSDNQRNWGETEGTVTLKAAGNVVQTQKVAIAVAKSDPAVNTQTPVLTLKEGTGSRLVATLNRNEGDTATATLYVDGVERSRETVGGNGQAGFSFQNGVHDYRVEAVDLAGNRTEQTLSQKEWWPLTKPSVRMEVTSRGGADRVPPLPPNMERKRMETLRLQLLGLPDNDYRAVRKITVTSSAGDVRELTGTEIEDVMLDVEVPVRSNGATTIEVKVEPKNGLPVKQSIKVLPGK